MDPLKPPPPTLVATREALRALACYAISPARKARTGRIGLRPTGKGIATPRFDDGTRMAINGDRLLIEPGFDVPISTLRAAAEFLGIELSPDPGVGHDLPPFSPDERLAVDAEASLWLGAWYDFGSRQLDRVADRVAEGTVTEVQLWPEHFDLAVTVHLDGAAINVGFSPGDDYAPRPYLYVGPDDRSRLTDSYWNAPFGAILTHAELLDTPDPDASIQMFIDQGLRLVTASQVARPLVR